MSSLESELSPLQVVERIRTHNFLLDIDSAPDMFKEGALNLQTQLNNALKLLSADLYSKKSHFILELVQNADDNQYAANVTPHLTLQVTPSRLVAINNETGFTDVNVRAICSVGASSKSKQKAGYIGEKGIGFKSVFTVSDTPEIHSNGFHFKFDRSQEGNLLGFVVPNWCEAPENLQQDCTTIILPAAKDYAFSANTLIDIDARLLLFLNKLRQLTLVHEGQQIFYHREDKDGISFLSATRNMETGEVTSGEMRYIRSALTFQMKDKFSDEKRPGIEKSTVVLAFPVDTRGAANPEPTSNVFAFLPIRQMGFKFPIQADFILNSSREEVLTDRPWNQLLQAGVAMVFSHAVEVFKKSEPLALSYLKYIPDEGDVVDPFFRSTRKTILDQLANKESLLSASGVWTQPNRLRIADHSFRMLFPSNVANELFGFDYIDSRIQGGNPLLRSLGTKDAGIPEALNVFASHATWLREQPLEWRARFYAYVANNLSAFVTAGLLKTACLPISDGTCVIPAQAHVFFPLSKGTNYGFEHELTLVDHHLYKEAQKHSERVPELFATMQVRPDEPYDLVNSHILPRHEGESWKRSEFKALTGHLRYVKEKLNEYLAAAAANGKSETQAFQLLRDGIWIGTKLSANGTWRFGRIGNLYFGKEYQSSFCVETLLDGALELEKIISPDYMDPTHPDFEAEAESWRNFFSRLGVRISPAVEADGQNWKCSRELQLLLDSSNPLVRKATLECMSQNWSNYSAHTTYTLTLGRSTYSPKETMFIESLRATQAPTRKRHAAALAESYLPTAELKSLLGDSLPYVDAALSDSMLDACGVTRKLDAKALVKRLKQLKAEGSGSTKQIQGIYRALDERLWASDATYIKQTFASEGLIQVKGTHKGWFTPGELVWASNGAFLDSLYPPLHSLYRDFSKFFCDKLGIPRVIPIARVVEALAHLESISDSEDRKAEALNIYRRANGALGPKFGREVQVPDWIETFKTEAVFIDQRGEVVPNDEYLFANDSSTFAALFEDEEELSFLAISPTEVPRLSKLLDASGVARLSDSFQIEVRNADSGVVNVELTARVHHSTPFLARALYSRRPEEFDEALKNGRLSSLRQLEVAEVAKVELVVSLRECSRDATTDMALSGNRVLYRAGAGALKDRLAEELTTFLATSKDLADLFARILMESDIAGIEDFLKVKGIGPLPTDLFAALETVTEVERDGEGSAVAHDTEADHTEKEVPQEDGEQSELEELASSSALGGPINSASRQPSAAPDAVGGARNSSAGNSHTTGFGSPADTPLDTKGYDPEGGGSSSIASARNLIPKGGEGRASDQNNETEKSFEGTSFGQPKTPSHHSLSTGAHANGRRQKRGGQQPSRTKTGRLLSYAEGPNDLNSTKGDEDPAKTAEREATGRAAVEYFMTTQAVRWKSLKEMAHNNPGFDVLAVADDGQDEFIEVKGQSGAWTEEGVALTPTELVTAQQKGSRYWLCVVEYAQDDKRRQLHLLRNPYGLTQQFRFDVGWKSAAESVATVPLRPEKDMYIDMPGVGRGRILSVRGKGKFFNLHVLLEDGRQVNKPFNPARMTLSKESPWQG